VRLELNAAVLAKRLRNFMIQETRIEFMKELFIVRAMIQKESYGFNIFVAVRIGEIQSATRPEDWKWIEGKENIADWTTRGKSPLDLGEESLWQNGPKFFQHQNPAGNFKSMTKLEIFLGKQSLLIFLRL